MEGLRVGKVVSIIDYVPWGGSVVGQTSVVVVSEKGGVIEGDEVGVDFCACCRSN